jgi:SNF2 family DNA or RNA helicase
VKWLLDTPRAFLGDDMGLGKTLSVLAAYDVLKNRSEVDFMIVIAPTSLIRNWINESSGWTPHIRLALISGSKKEKLHSIKQIGWGGVKCDGVVLNYESIRLDYVRDEISNLLRKKNALLVIDESQRVKNPRGETFKSFSTLARLTNRRVLLSGTPTPKDISDIWTQYYLLDDGERFGRNFYRWLEGIADIGNKYSAVAVNSFKPEGVKETIRRAQEIMLRRKKDEVLDLPQKIFTTRYVKLSGEQAKRYDEIRKDLLLRMTSVNGKSFIRQIDSILEEYLRAVQVASNPRLIDPAWVGEPAKFKELDSIVDEIVKERDEKIVIWTNYIVNTKELIKRYSKLGAADFSGEVSPEKRNEIVSRFQSDPSCRILVAVPAAGGVGITLTAAQTAVYIDKTWNGEHWMQSVDRLHRIGQTGTVNIISISACKIDELISRNLNKKVRLQREVLGDDERRVHLETEEDYALPSLEDFKEALGA